MTNIANPLPYLSKREYGVIYDLKSQLFSKRLNAAKNLYRRDLVCHFGCVNAIEFSNNGELLVSGGDDRRVMLWQFGKALLDYNKPEPLFLLHQSNIFCLGITKDNRKIFSGGNDDVVIVHDTKTKAPIEVLQHQRAVCGLSIDPLNEEVVATAGNDGRLLLFDTRQSVQESLVVSRSRKAFHAVMFHPYQASIIVSANAREGVALWDLRSPKHPVVRYIGNNGSYQNSMSVRFNESGNLILALRRRQCPVLYAVDSPEPIAEFYHQDYYNSCTMKSCSFAGEHDQYVLSGSDDFNLYMWKVPDAFGDNITVQQPHIVLYGHRSIVNQVRFNPHYSLIASSGVEKIIKVWSTIEYPKMRGALLEEAQGPENPRELYSHEDYVSLVHHSQFISHNYAEQSTSEDPRMMAFFDSLVQRELECLAEETDSLDGSSTALDASGRSNVSDSSDSDQIMVDFLPLPPKRTNHNGARSQRCPNRLARVVTHRYPKNIRPHKRGTHRRNKIPHRVVKGMKGMSGVGSVGSVGSGGLQTGGPGARGVFRRAGGSAPSSERTDSDDGHYLFRTQGRIIRPLRRRINLTRTAKRKSKCPSYRKINTRLNGTSLIRDNHFMNFSNIEEQNLALPSTSSGYRGQSSQSLFRIAEVDSDDEHSASSRCVSPRMLTYPNTTPPHNRALARLMNETNESEVESSASTESATTLTPACTPASGVGTSRRCNADLSEETEFVSHKFRQRVKKSRRNLRKHIDTDSN